MRDKRRILALLVVLVIVVSCIAPCIAVVNSTNNASSNHSEEFNATMTTIPSPSPLPAPSPFYTKHLPSDDARVMHAHHHKLFAHQLNADEEYKYPIQKSRFDLLKIYKRSIPKYKLEERIIKEASQKSNYSFSISGNVSLLWGYVNDERDARVDFDFVNDVNGDGIDDIPISDNNSRLLLVSGKDGSVIWSKDYSFVEMEGLYDDANGDGIEDIIIGRDEYNEVLDETNITVELISGKEGAKIWNKTISYEREYSWTVAHSIYRDLDGDGVEDMLVECHQWYPGERCEIYAISSKDGSKLWNKTFETWVKGYCYCFEDLTGDGMYDFAISTYNRSKNIGELFVIKASDGSVEWHESFGGDIDWACPEYDFDGDGLPDVDVENWDYDNETSTIFVLKGTDGSEIWNKTYNSFALVRGLDDINEDGTEDLYVGLENFSSHRVTEIQVLSGVSGSVVWSKDVDVDNLGWWCGDFNIDGRDDILLINSTEIAENRYLYDVTAISSVNGYKVWEKSFVHDIVVEIPEGAYTWAGGWACGASDLNGDGVDDISLDIEYHYDYWDPDTQSSYDFSAEKFVFINGVDGSGLWSVEYTIDEDTWGWAYTWDDYTDDGIDDVLLSTGKGVYLLNTSEYYIIPKSEIHVHKKECLSTYYTHIDHNLFYNFTTEWDANVWAAESMDNIDLDNVTYTITTSKNFTYIKNWERYRNGTEKSFNLTPTEEGQNYTWLLPLEDRVGSGIDFVLDSPQPVQDNPWADMEVSTTDENSYTRVNVTFKPVLPLDWGILQVRGDQIVDVSAYPPEFEIEVFTSGYVELHSGDINQNRIYNFSVLVDNPNEVSLWLEALFGWEVEPPSNIITLPVAELGSVTVKADVPVIWEHRPTLPQYVQSIAIEFEEIKGFDTGSPNNPYPSIFGTHNGTITPNQSTTVTKLYTYPCIGTGGHSEYVAFYYPNGTLIAEANWTGYSGDWHNISFLTLFSLEAGKTYNYTIHTGSYPQIIHNQTLTNAYGTINCTKFIDANGKEYNDWIPAIRLEGKG